MADPEKRIDIAKRRVLEARRTVERQKRLIERRKKLGLDTRTARRLPLSRSQDVRKTYQRPRARESWDAARAQSRMNDCQLPEFDPNGFPVSALRAFKSTLVTALFRCRLDF
jgi:hypothetical protein